MVIVVGLGVAIGWYSSNSSKRPAIPDVPIQENPAGTETVRTEPVAPRQGDPEPLAPVQSRTVVANPASNVPVIPPSNTITNWEEKLDDILGGEQEETEKARQMVALLPGLPEEGQMEVAQHLSNLVPDEEYGMISGFLTNSLLSEDVLDVFISDSLNRPNAVKLPALLEVARSPGNPKASEAKEILELFLEEDYGDNWALWQTKLQEWIANNPD